MNIAHAMSSPHPDNSHILPYMVVETPLIKEKKISHLRDPRFSALLGWIKDTNIYIYIYVFYKIFQSIWNALFR